MGLKRKRFTMYLPIEYKHIYPKSFGKFMINLDYSYKITERLADEVIRINGENCLLFTEIVDIRFKDD